MPDDTTHPQTGGQDFAAFGEGGLSRHLDLDALSAAIDGTLPPSDAAAARAHLAACPDCRRDEAELRATVDLLRNLPQYEPSRSFVLGPEHARGRSAGSAWRPAAATATPTLPSSRPSPAAPEATAAGEAHAWGSRLLPGIRVLQVATAVVALLLVLVTAGDLMSPDPDPVPVMAPQGFAAMPAEQEAPPVPAAAPTVTGAQPAAARAVIPADITADGTNATGGTSQAASGTRAAQDAPGPTSPWRVAQLALALVLLWLVVSLAGRLLIDRHERMPG